MGLKKFIEFLQSNCPEPADDREQGGTGKKLEVRAFPSRNSHAKVYIGRFSPNDRDYGFVITGSSNFSYAGLVTNREFNIELRQRRDVEFALNQFQELWRQSVDISEEFIEDVKGIIAQGLMARKTAQTIKKAFEKTLDPLAMVAILRKHVRRSEIANQRTSKQPGARRELILLAYLVTAGGE